MISRRPDPSDCFERPIILTPSEKVRVVANLNADATVRLVAVTAAVDVEFGSGETVARPPVFFVINFAKVVSARLIRTEIAIDRIGGRDEVDAVELNGHVGILGVFRSGGSFLCRQGTPRRPVESVGGYVGYVWY